MNELLDTELVFATEESAYVGDSEPLIRGYDESTLVLDMIDARTGRLVWRGWAQESLQNFVNDQDALKAHIEKSVVQMLQRLPL